MVKTIRVAMALLVVFQLPVNSVTPRSAFAAPVRCRCEECAQSAFFTLVCEEQSWSQTQSTVTESPPALPESGNGGKRWPSRPPSQTAGPSGYRHRPDESDLLEGGHDNSTEIVNMDHVYYASKITGPGDAGAADAWVNTELANKDEWKTSGFLSARHRRVQRVNLSFDFPFYGHMLKQVTVATGGFIYTGELIHRLLTATQYIAPLMADLALGPCSDSSVFYFDNGSALVVQWTRLRLQDEPQSGTFTFQAALHSDGRIVFAYTEIPVDIRHIGSENHPVKVGLSDAFVVLHKIEQIPNVRRRTIYEYHKVEILKSKICNATTIEVLPLPTCLQFSSCAPCVTSQIGFNCSWCSRLQRCSSGFDRNRQDWVDHGCQDERRDPRCRRVLDIADASSRQLTPGPADAVASAATSARQKTSGPTAVPLGKTSPAANQPPGSGGKDASGPSSSTGPPAAGGEDKDTGRREQAGLLVGVVVVTVVMVTGILVSVYVYNRPASTASLFFMERRPARWSTMKFRRGSGHPSYAEVEPPGVDGDGAAVIDPKQSFVMALRRESEQKEGFIVPDPRERFLCSESS